MVIVFEVVFGGGNISSSYSRLLKVRWAGKLSTTGTKLEPRLQRYVGNKTSGEKNIVGRVKKGTTIRFVKTAFTSFSRNVARSLS